MRDDNSVKSDTTFRDGGSEIRLSYLPSEVHELKEACSGSFVFARAICHAPNKAESSRRTFSPAVLVSAVRIQVKREHGMGT